MLQHVENRRALAQLENVIDVHQKESEKQLSSLDNKIDKEVANLLAVYERYRNDVLKYSAGEYQLMHSVSSRVYRGPIIHSGIFQMGAWEPQDIGVTSWNPLGAGYSASLRRINVTHNTILRSSLYFDFQFHPTPVHIKNS